MTALRISLIACTALALTSLATTVVAQHGPGMGPGLMMGPGMMDHGSYRRMCGPGAAGFAEWRVERFERIIKPTDSQRPKFDEFKAASLKAAETMRAACPAEIPRTMPARMEAMEKRMEATLQAVKTLRPALDAFYATLDTEQKARLDWNAGPRRFWRWRDRW